MAGADRFYAHEELVGIVTEYPITLTINPTQISIVLGALGASRQLSDIPDCRYVTESLWHLARAAGFSYEDLVPVFGEDE